MPHSVLVTGALGQVGLHTVSYLLAAGHRVVAVDLRTPVNEAVAARLGDTVEVIWGNICDPDLWRNALPRVDTVVHLAAIIPPAVDSHPERAIAVNQTATLELVKQMEASSAAKRLIFASSMVVAGFEQHLRVPPLKADELPNPADLYGRTKVEAERYIQASSLHWSILRLTLVSSAEFSLTQTKNTEIMFEGSETGRVEIVHSEDAGLAFANAVNCDAAIGKILFIGGGASCRTYVLDFYNRMLGSLGLGPLNPDVMRPGPAYYFGDWVDTEESQRLLNFQRHSLEDICNGIRASVGYRRWLLKLAAPLINRLIERSSPYRSHK